MKKWKVLSTKNKLDSEGVVLEELFKLRKISDRENFLNPELKDLTLKNTGLSEPEIKKACVLIKKQISNKNKIIILGDYDVDGICASAVLWETIYKKYKNVFPYIPDRFSEGYGISIKTLDNLIKKYPDVSLIITVDNGIVAREAIDYALKKGIKIIITDHHIKDKLLPKADAIVHTVKLCGAAVSWMLSRELNFLSKDEMDEQLELVCLATIADLVPLNEVNRIIVKFGLEYLHNTRRIGLIEIYRNAGIDKNKIDTYHIGHIIGPRLNAAGRISHAIDSLRLLCSSDKKFVKNKARILENTNKIRQQMVMDSTAHAKLSLIESKLENLIVVKSETYSEGIIGLISSRLVDEHYRPSIAISVGKERSKGSARSINGVNIVEILRSVSHTLLEVGGHPMAAGFSLETANLELFHREIKKKAKTIDKKYFKKEISADLELSSELIGESLYKKLRQFSPFGIGNPEPVFLSKKLVIKNVRRLGKDGSHLKLTLQTGKAYTDAIGFGMGEKEAHVGENIDAIFILDENEWNGNKKIQLKLKDFRESI